MGLYFFAASREFDFRDGFARDCLLQQRVSDELLWRFGVPMANSKLIVYPPSPTPAELM
jgi:hypothetical protein